MVLRAQGAPAAAAMPTMEQANQLFTEKNWAAAEKAFAAVTQSEPANKLAWLRLGTCRQNLRQYELALEAYRHIDNDPSQIGLSALYREAASLARLNQKANAIVALNKAVDAGLARPEMFKAEADFASLQQEPAFNALLERADAIAHPCSHAPEHRQFDFWIGEWEVVTTEGHNPAGTSSIQLILDRCVLLENWTGGLTGKSFNHYDTRSKKWIQDWVDSQSKSVHFEGGLENGVMSFYAASFDGNNQPIRRHLQFMKVDDDHVRQWSQQSHDGGKTWTPEYDFTYIRKK
jgi:hypothetical protein